MWGPKDEKRRRNLGFVSQASTNDGPPRETGIEANEPSQKHVLSAHAKPLSPLGSWHRERKDRVRVAAPTSESPGAKPAPFLCYGRRQWWRRLPQYTVRSKVFLEHWAPSQALRRREGTPGEASPAGAVGDTPAADRHWGTRNVPPAPPLELRNRKKSLRTRCRSPVSIQRSAGEFAPQLLTGRPRISTRDRDARSRGMLALGADAALLRAECPLRINDRLETSVSRTLVRLVPRGYKLGARCRHFFFFVPFSFSPSFGGYIRGICGSCSPRPSPNVDASTCYQQRIRQWRVYTAPPTREHPDLYIT